MKTTVINLFGGPGSGKSTTSAGVYSLLKLHNINCELITEFAKDLTWENRQTALSNQYYILGKQHHKLFRLVDKVDIVITDSPLLLSYVYGKINSNVNEKFYDFITDLNSVFNNKNFFLKRVKQYNTSGRNQTLEEAKKLDETILKTLNDLNLDFTTTYGDHSGINLIARSILNNIDRTLDLAIKGD